MSTAPSSNKYHIKSLEEDISLFDRKLAHLLKFESFPSDTERQLAASKLSAKRERLVRTVRDLTEGVPELEASAPPAKKTKAAAKPKTSTRSKAAAKSAAPAEPPVVAEQVIAAEQTAEAPEIKPTESDQPLPIDSGLPALPRQASPYAGTSLDSELELKNYLQNRAKN
jgi:citrate synthase